MALLIEKKSSSRQGGARRGAGRKAGTQNKVTEALKGKSIDFFAAILDDETEARFWRYFMTGYVVDVHEDGTSQILPIPVNPTCYKAFQRAVEYKRGMPVQPITGSRDGEPIRIEIEHIGGTISSGKAAAQAN